MMSVRDLLKQPEGVSSIRNHTIARIFKELDWVETWGSGYKRIKEACEEMGYPLPVWREVGLNTEACFKPLPVSEGPRRVQEGFNMNPPFFQLRLKRFSPFAMSLKRFPKCCNT